ncbi:histidine--tRNA ligase [Actinomadura sp. WAC 06369]|uniref:histidine--tRNA ligase n=1 Tax=Actinomadura sp. WAC 06369 TaxID=2203193 RepID=UPI000F78315C|nr:histidine--tRNA ligase [Actinomadura sp. WAC 06369]RSN41755.1 histidine--tRNA ligase [Actinomadura sp. WAC 06369]
MASQQFEPPSGTRDFLATDLYQRERVFEAARSVFTRYGFEPLQTPAFERLETLTGKYGDEGDKLIFKILKRGAHEASGEADMALRYDLTVPLARVVAAHGSRLPTPYKRYAIGPVWRADRPGKGRFREFTQCDIDIVGSSSPLVEAEVVCAGADALDAMGVRDFTILVNSRRALSGLMQVYGVAADRAAGALITLDKLDKQEPASVVAELVEARGLDRGIAGELVRDVTADDAVERMRAALKDNADGREGLAEVDRLLELAGPHVGAARIRFAPNLVRGLDYYTGAIWEVVSPGMPGSIASGGRYDHLIRTLGGPDVTACGFSIGVERIIGALGDADDGTDRIDIAVTIMNDDYATDALGFAQGFRRAGWRAEVFLGTSKKLGKQLRWAADRRARFALLQGDSEHAEEAVTIRNMETGDQQRVPVTDLFTALDSELRM